MIKKWWGAYKRKRALRNIREGMSLLGVDMSLYTDGQIEQAVMNGAKMLAGAGMTAEELSFGILKAFRIMDGIEG